MPFELLLTVATSHQSFGILYLPKYITILITNESFFKNVSLKLSIVIISLLKTKKSAKLPTLFQLSCLSKFYCDFVHISKTLFLVRKILYFRRESDVTHLVAIHRTNNHTFVLQVINPKLFALTWCVVVINSTTDWSPILGFCVCNEFASRLGIMSLRRTSRSIIGTV